MGVMSKLLYAAVPKSFTGLLLWVIPIAAAVIVVAYPQAVMQLLVRDDPEKLLEELTTNGTNARKKKIQKSKERLIKKEDASLVQVEKDGLTENSKVPVKEVSEEEQLMELAAIQAKKSQSFKKVNVKGEKASSEVLSPVVSSITINNNHKEGGDDGTWNRVPTKEEEALATLKSKMVNLTRQLEVASEEVVETRALLEREQKRAVEAEKELKDRTRSYQIRWVEMESEISNLRNSKAEIMNKLNDLSMIQSTKDSHVAELESQMSRIALLEAELEEAKALKEKISIQAANESKLKAELDNLFVALHAERDSLAKEKNVNEELAVQISLSNQLVSTLKTQLSEFEGTESGFKKDIELLQAELANVKSSWVESDSRIKSLELDIEGKNTQLVNLESTKGQLKVELEASQAEHSQLLIKNGELVHSIQLAESRNREVALQLEQKEAIHEEDTKRLNEELSIAQGKISQLETELEALLNEQQQQPHHQLGKEEEAEVIEEVKKDELNVKYVQLQNDYEEKLTERLELARKVEEAEGRAKDILVQLDKAERKLQIANTVAEAKYSAFKQEVDALKTERDQLAARLVSSSTVQSS